MSAVPIATRTMSSRIDGAEPRISTYSPTIWKHCRAITFVIPPVLVTAVMAADLNATAGKPKRADMTSSSVGVSGIPSSQ
ncbi:hypothetical protein D3C71_1323980 [compost metagenome]